MNMVSNENLVIIQLNPTTRFNYGTHLQCYDKIHQTMHCSNLVKSRSFSSREGQNQI